MTPATTRRTRGPRTADERGSDAARSAATLLEKAPRSEYAENFLWPVAALLRLMQSHPGAVDLAAVGVEYDKLRHYCGWLEADISTRRVNKLRDEVQATLQKSRAQLRESQALLEDLKPRAPRPGLKLVREAD